MIKSSKDKQIKEKEDKSGGKEKVKRFYPTLGETLTREEAEKKIKNK